MATVGEVTASQMIFYDLDNAQKNFNDETTWVNESLPVGSIYRMSSFTMAHGTVHLLVTSVVLGVIILATIFGNVFVIAAIILERNLRNVANYLIASLAAADLMVAALVMPLAAVSEVSTTWFLGSVLCDAWTLFDMLCCTASILHLVAISLDRYWAVTRVDYIHHRSAQRILGMIAASWAVSALISLPPLFGHRDLELSADETGVCQISQDRGMAVFEVCQISQDRGMAVFEVCQISQDRSMAVFEVCQISQDRGMAVFEVCQISQDRGMAVFEVCQISQDRGMAVFEVCQISQDRGMAVFSTVGAFYLPLIAMIIIYARIYRAARSRIRKQNFARKRPLETRQPEISERSRHRRRWMMGDSKSRETSGIKRGGNNVDNDEISVSIPLTEYSSVTAASTPPVTPSHRKYRAQLTAIRIVLKTFKSTCGHGTTDKVKSAIKNDERGFEVERHHHMNSDAESVRHSMVSLTSDSNSEYRNRSVELPSKYDDDENSSLPLRRVSLVSTEDYVNNHIVDVFNCTQTAAVNVREPISTSGLTSNETPGDMRLSKRISVKRSPAETFVTLTSYGSGLRRTGNGPKTTLVDTSVTRPSLPIGGCTTGGDVSRQCAASMCRDGQLSAREKLKQKRERKAARTLAIVTGTFVLCWLPFFIVALIQPFFDESKLPGYPPELRSVIGWLGYINSLLNPVIYTVFNPDFRSAFRKILCDRYRTQSSARTWYQHH